LDAFLSCRFFTLVDATISTKGKIRNQSRISSATRPLIIPVISLTHLFRNQKKCLLGLIAISFSKGGHLTKFYGFPDFHFMVVF